MKFHAIRLTALIRTLPFIGEASAGMEAWREEERSQSTGRDPGLCELLGKFQLQGTMKKFVNYEHLMSKVEFWNVLHFG